MLFRSLAGLAAGFLKLSIMQFALTECIGLTFFRLLSACGRSALIAALTVAAAAPSLSFYDGSFGGALACLLTAGISAGVVLFGTLFGLNHPLARELTNAWMSRNKPA